MGGCRPEHFAVVLAAMEALLDPVHNLNGVSQTTHVRVSLVIVNGPIARRLGFNSGDGVFRNGFRANAAVGRGVRLALWNLGGAVPGETDKSTLSHPAEYAFCIAEAEDDSPWPPLHVERGCPPGSDAVTVFVCEGSHSVFCYGTHEEMLYVLADSMSGLSTSAVCSTVALEQRGLHTVTIVRDNFEAAARTQARLQQMPDLELVVVPPRQGGETADDQRRKAEALRPALLTKLVEPI
jgi:hypothetical protein